MKIVLLIQLSFQLSIDGHAKKVGIRFTSRRRLVQFILAEDVAKTLDRLTGMVHFLVD